MLIPGDRRMLHLVRKVIFGGDSQQMPTLRLKIVILKDLKSYASNTSTAAWFRIPQISS